MIELSDADRKSWHDTALALHQLQRQADEGAEAVVALGDQLGQVRRLIGKTAATPQAVSAAIDATAAKIADLRVRLGVPTGEGRGGGGGGGANANRNVRARITSVKTQIMASTSAPTAFQAGEARIVRDELAKAIASLNAVITDDMPALAQTLAANKSLIPALKPIRPISD